MPFLNKVELPEVTGVYALIDVLQLKAALKEEFKLKFSHYLITMLTESLGIFLYPQHILGASQVIKRILHQCLVVKLQECFMD